MAEAAGRIAAEMITPYPSGIPAVLPGERLTEPVPAYLRTGLDAGMNLADPEDPELPEDPVLERIRVLAECRGSETGHATGFWGHT
ncbi:hypothetical protein HDC93_005864 [Streptomyces sp. AK010]|nr:hypothetical protein [Streptomyces sp. AK010]